MKSSDNCEELMKQSNHLLKTTGENRTQEMAQIIAKVKSIQPSNSLLEK
ncbi:MAG: hypothetical protein FWE02_05500 [Defluviitaleaceae bacterium]|nr:hypothetical protein [Defluviitaleaceae bacterium]